MSTPVDDGSQDTHFQEELEATLESRTATQQEIAPIEVTNIEKGYDVQQDLNDTLERAQAPPTTAYNPEASSAATVILLRQQISAILGSRRALTAARDAVPTVPTVPSNDRVSTSLNEGNELAFNIVKRQLEVIEAEVLRANTYWRFTTETYLERTLGHPSEQAATEGKQWTEENIRSLGERQLKHWARFKEYERQRDLVKELVSLRPLIVSNKE